MEIKKESMKFILTACEDIKEHLERSRRIEYDFRADITSDLTEIETEAKDWIEKYNLHKTKHKEQYIIVSLDQPSYENGFLFWKPKGMGYTSNLIEAGSWSKKKAMKITKENTCCSNIAIGYKSLLDKSKIKQIVDWNEMQKFRK